MREVTPEELRELNRKSFKDTQKIIRKRLREIAASGESKAKYNENNYCAGEYIKGWLRSLGFTCKEIGWGGWVEITWPEDILKQLRSEQLEFSTRHIPAKFTWGVKIERKELGTWKYDPSSPYDYVCSVCGKHSEYKTDFCCNCGTKMSIEENKNGT